MPQCCVVPKCSTRQSGHRFPTDPALRKAWLIAIKRERFTLTQHSRVCNKHFIDSDYILPQDSVRQNPKPMLRKGTIPTKFQWTADSSPLAVARADRRKRRYEAKLVKESTINVVEGNVIDEQESQKNNRQEWQDINDVNSNSIIENEVVIEDQHRSIGIQCDIINLKDNKHQIVKCNVFTNTISVTSGAFRIDDFRDKRRAAELQFYTGFDDYEHFMFVFHLLGPQVNHLLYYPNCTIIKDNARILLPPDEFFLVLVKLRRGMLNKELALRFDISPSSVTRIVITWINFLYCQLKELNIWASHSVLSRLMNFKGKKCEATIIIDCTEVEIVQPKNPIAQQQTYSTYKSCNTLKVLVGISQTGAVTFVSDAYGGSISDRQLFERCGLISTLEEEDVVMADRGFNIQDLLAHKDIRVNIPEFIPKNKGQLEPPQLVRSKKVSSKRIHIERVIGLGKTYRILAGPLSANLVSLGSRLVFVCFMLANFRSNIV